MFKNHVGRPSNEEIKRRKIKKAIVILLPVIIIFIGLIVISKGNLKRLMGNSVTSEYYCEDENYTLEGRECVKTITMEPNLLGDANKDGKIDINDVTAISKSISSNNAADIMYVADVNSDKLVNETDIKLIQSFLGGSIEQSTVGYTENIGVALVCPNDFKMDNNVCKKEDRVTANSIKKVQDDKKDSDSNNNSSVNSQDNNTIENNNSKTETNNSSYVITYDANGGTGKMNSTIVDEKVTNIPENKFTNGNAKFKGWTVYNKTTGKWLIYLSRTESIFDEINQTTAQYYSPRILSDKESVSLIPASALDELIFYAQWDNTFTIKYNANGGKGVMVPQSITYGTLTNLYANKFTRENYVFNGWRAYSESKKQWACYLNKDKTQQGYTTDDNCKKYGYVVYKDSVKVAKTTTPGTVITFYAQWEKVFTITYDASGGTGTMQNQTIIFGQNTKLSKNQFSRSGYNFIGWRSYNNTTGKWYCKIDSKGNVGKTDKNTCEKYGYVLYKDQATVSKSGNPGDSLTFYAQWNNKFTIKYNANGGTGSMNQQLIVYGQNTKISKNKFSKSGYGFVGWKKYNNTTGKWYCSDNTNANKCSSYAIYKDQATVSKSGAPGQTVTFYAVWTDKPVSASITKLNGSTSLTKGSVITSGIYFKVNDNTRDYYYKWYAYKNGKTINKPSCIKVPKSKYTEVKLTIDGTKSGKVELYWDSKCKTKIKSNNTIYTQKFTCSNCNVSNNNSSSNSNSNTSNNSSSSSSSNSSSNSNSSNKSTKKTYTCPSGYYKHSKYGCVKQTSIKCNKGIYSGSKGKCRISNVKYTQSCNAVKNGKVTVGWKCPITNKMNPVGGKVNSESAKKVCNSSCYGYKDKYVTPSCTGNGTYDSSLKLCLDINKKPNASTCPTGYKYNKNNNLCEK